MDRPTNTKRKRTQLTSRTRPTKPTEELKDPSPAPTRRALKYPSPPLISFLFPVSSAASRLRGIFYKRRAPSALFTRSHPADRRRRPSPRTYSLVQSLDRSHPLRISFPPRARASRPRGRSIDRSIVGGNPSGRSPGDFSPSRGFRVTV